MTNNYALEYLEKLAEARQSMDIVLDVIASKVRLDCARAVCFLCRESEVRLDEMSGRFVHVTQPDVKLFGEQADLPPVVSRCAAASIWSMT